MNEERILRRLDDILRRLVSIEERLALQGALTMSAIDDLAAQVQANTDAEKSAVAVIEGLAHEIAASAGDTTKINALASQLKASAAALGAAIVANTPAAPPVPATPPATP